MEHILHPWHWLPVLAALPFLATWFQVAKARFIPTKATTE